jgi:hypothetical protein
MQVRQPPWGAERRRRRGCWGHPLIGTSYASVTHRSYGCVIRWSVAQWAIWHTLGTPFRARRFAAVPPRERHQVSAENLTGIEHLAAARRCAAQGDKVFADVGGKVDAAALDRARGVLFGGQRPCHGCPRDAGGGRAGRRVAPIRRPRVCPPDRVRGGLPSRASAGTPERFASGHPR